MTNMRVKLGSALGQKESIEIQKAYANIDAWHQPPIAEEWSAADGRVHPNFGAYYVSCTFSFRLPYVIILLRKYHMRRHCVREQSKFTKRDESHA